MEQRAQRPGSATRGVAHRESDEISDRERRWLLRHLAGEELKDIAISENYSPSALIMALARLRRRFGVANTFALGVELGRRGLL